MFLLVNRDRGCSVPSGIYMSLFAFLFFFLSSIHSEKWISLHFSNLWYFLSRLIVDYAMDKHLSKTPALYGKAILDFRRLLGFNIIAKCARAVGKNRILGSGKYTMVSHFRFWCLAIVWHFGSGDLSAPLILVEYSNASGVDGSFSASLSR